MGPSAEVLQQRARSALKSLTELDQHRSKFAVGQLVREVGRSYVSHESRANHLYNSP